MKFYRTIFKEALQNSWRSKYLWFFGLFATLWGSGVELNLLLGDNSGVLGTGLFSELQRWADTGVFSKDGWINIAQLATTEPFAFFVMISLLATVLVLFLFVVWISIVSQVALVFNAGKIRLGKSHSFKEGLQVGIKKFWQILFFNLGLRIFLGIVFLLLLISMIHLQGSSGGLAFVSLFLLFIVLSIIVSFIIKYAVAFIVIREEKVMKALRLSWKLFIDNWLVSLEMAFLLFFISFVGALLIIVMFLIIMTPIMFIVLLFQNAVSMVNVFMVIISIMISYLVAIVTFGSFISSFKTLSWTNLFIELIGRGGKSKLDRMFGK